MRGLLIGLSLGVVLGLAVSAIAQSSWSFYTGAKLMAVDGDPGRLARHMYAAGATDMLHAVMSANRTLGAIHGGDWVIRQADCLKARSQGGLGQFTDFAEALWRGRSESAASILLDGACN